MMVNCLKLYIKTDSKRMLECCAQIYNTFDYMLKIYNEIYALLLTNQMGPIAVQEKSNSGPLKVLVYHLQLQHLLTLIDSITIWDSQ